MATPTLVQVAHNRMTSARSVDVTLPVAASAGDALIAVVIGQKNMSPYSQRTDTNPYSSLLNASPAPVLNDDKSQSYTSLKTLTLVDLLASTPTFPSTSESNTDYAAKYPSFFVSAALNVAAGTRKVNVKSAYLGQNNPWSATVAYQIGEAVTVGGVIYVANAVNTNSVPPSGSWTSVVSVNTDSRFAGGSGVNVYEGMDIVLLDLAGIVTSAAVDGTAVAATSTANPANAGAITTVSNGDLILAIGWQKNGNAFSAPAGWTLAHQGKLVGQEGHVVIMYQLQTTAGAITPGFTNPINNNPAGLILGSTSGVGYETAVIALALKHS